MIYNGDIANAAGAFAELRPIYPNDEELKYEFGQKQERNNQKVAYILRRLEAEQRRIGHGKMADETTLGDKLTVEHVLPKNPGGAWSDLTSGDEDVADEYATRLGNTCLLTEVNRDLGRKPFDEKRAVYAASEILLTREIADYAVWDRQAIERRQARMAKLAAGAWRFQ